MIAVVRLSLLVGLLLGLSACSLQPPQPVASGQAPVKAHAHFAPPPDGPSHWDPQLQVYVLQGSPPLYYRQRTYYRWSNGWSRSISPNGPWEETNVQGVPPGLSKQYAQ